MKTLSYLLAAGMLMQGGQPDPGPKQMLISPIALQDGDICIVHDNVCTKIEAHSALRLHGDSPLGYKVMDVQLADSAERIPEVSQAEEKDDSKDYPGVCRYPNGGTTIIGATKEHCEENGGTFLTHKVWTCKDGDAVYLESVNGKKHYCVRF